MTEESAIKILLDADESNTRVCRELFLQFSSDLPKTADDIYNLHDTFIQAYGQGVSNASPCKETIMENAVKKLHISLEDVIKYDRQSLKGFDDQQRKLFETARKAYATIYASRVCAILLINMSKYFLFSVTDLHRLRVSAALGYLRLQIESIAFLYLFQIHPELAIEWMNIRPDRDSRNFFNKTRPQVTNFVEHHELWDPWNTASIHGQHSRVASICRNFDISTITDNGTRKTEILIGFQECTEENQHDLILNYIYILLQQIHFFHILSEIIPQTNSPKIQSKLSSISAGIDLLRDIFKKNFPDAVKAYEGY